MKRVRDVMTTRVIVVGESTPFKEIAALMQRHSVSAVPVVDEDQRLVGIVSEGDLLLKEERAVEERPPLVFPSRRRRIERTKAEGLVARELMTANVVTIGPEASLGRAARVMHERRVKRLPVVDANGRVSGIVSRADLLTTFLRPDREIREAVEKALDGPTRWVEPGRILVSVTEGVVTLEGRIERRSQIPIFEGIARNVDGVVDVEPRLEYEIDDVTPGLEVVTPWGAYPRS